MGPQRRQLAKVGTPGHTMEAGWKRDGRPGQTSRPAAAGAEWLVPRVFGGNETKRRSAWLDQQFVCLNRADWIGYSRSLIHTAVWSIHLSSSVLSTRVCDGIAFTSQPRRRSASTPCERICRVLGSISVGLAGERAGLLPGREGGSSAIPKGPGSRAVLLSSCPTKSGAAVWIASLWSQTIIVFSIFFSLPPRPLFNKFQIGC